jgi:hypothetical protein
VSGDVPKFPSITNMTIQRDAATDFNSKCLGPPDMESRVRWTQLTGRVC